MPAYSWQGGYAIWQLKILVEMWSEWQNVQIVLFFSHGLSVFLVDLTKRMGVIFFSKGLLNSIKKRPGTSRRRLNRDG